MPDRLQSRDSNIDFYALGMVFLGHFDDGRLDQFHRHLLRTRAPGMSINRVPILSLGHARPRQSRMLAIPAVSLAFFLLWLDRQFGTHFFDPRRRAAAALAASLLDVRASLGLCDRAAGDGHRLRRAADVLPPSAGRLHAVALATVATMMLGFGVWVHHMFATGLPPLSPAFFGAARHRDRDSERGLGLRVDRDDLDGRPVFTTAFLFFAGFIFLFVIGGVSGFMTARCRSTGS